MYRALSLSILILTTLAVGGCASSEPKKSSTEQAKEHWDTARAGVLASLGKDQFESGQFDKARKTIDQALALDPANPGTLVLSARLHIERGDLERAEATLVSAGEIDPTNAQVDYYKGVVYQRWHQKQKSHDAYAAAMQKDPRELAYVMARSEMLLSLQQYDGAIELLRGEMPNFENSAIIRHSLGQMYLTQKQYRQAVDVLRQATVLATEDQSIREHLALAYFHNGDLPQAIELFNRLLRDPDNESRYDLHIALGEAQMQLGRYAEARGAFDAACRIRPASAQAWLSHAKACMQLKDMRRADASLQRSLALDNESAEGFLLLGYLRVQEERWSEALGAFQKANLLDRSDPVSVCMIGYVMQKTGKHDQALHFYGRALQLAPHDEMAQRLMASISAE
jgi:tetratricopeptide (TPR) repeat protein